MPRGADQYPGGDVHRPRAAGDVDVGLGIEGPRDVRRFSHEAMATVFEVFAVHPDARYAAQAAQATFELVDRLEGELSRFLPNSDIARINHLAAGESMRVRRSAIECLIIARHLFDLTGGAFDISIGTGLPSLDLDADDVRGPLDEGRGPRGPGRHRQGLRGRSDGGVARGVGPRAGAHPRGLQLRARARGAGGTRRLAADLERSGAPVTGARSPLGTPDGARRLRLAQRRPHRGPSHRQAGPRAARGLGRTAAASAASERRPRRPTVAAGAVTDALTTAFMLLSPEEIAALCESSPGLEAWILPESAGDADGEADCSTSADSGLVAVLSLHVRASPSSRRATGRLYFRESTRRDDCQLRRERRASVTASIRRAGASTLTVGRRCRTMAQTAGDTMAAENEKGKEKTQAGAEGPPKAAIGATC